MAGQEALTDRMLTAGPDAGLKVRNYISGGESRCVQAAFRMIVESFTGNDPGEARADALTGYVEGRGTWQFRMLLALADLGFHVVDHEALDVESFVRDPEAAIRAQVQDEKAVQLILGETDRLSEVDAARRCLESPLIRFIDSVPTMFELAAQAGLGRMVMCNVDLQVLEGKPRREGHILLVERIEDRSVIAHDPGPRGTLGKVFDRELFENAWRSPSPSMANYISVWK